MSERREGWYWVEITEGWESAHWTGAEWEIVGTDDNVSDDTMHKIGPRIPTPDEPWQCVPVELIDWVRGAQELMREMPGDWPATANQADMLLSAAPRPEDV